MQEKSKLRNNSIDVFKYFCALLVVGIHAHPFEVFGTEAHNIFLDYFSRIAVPFFFIVSGYFYSKKLHSGKKPFKAYVGKLLIIWLVWNTAYAIRLSIVNYKKGTLNRDYFVFLIKAYLYRAVSEHLWFIMSLIVAICVLTLVHKLNLEKLYAVGTVGLFLLACFGYGYYIPIGSKLPLLSKLYADDSMFTTVQRLTMFGTGFTALGNIIERHEKALTSKKRGFYIFFAAVCYALYVGEKLALTQAGWGGSMLFTFMLYPLMAFIFLSLLKIPAPSLSVPAKYLRNASSFTYYAHIMFIYLAGVFFSSKLVIYAVVCVVTTLLSFVITKINNKYLNYLNI